MWSLFQNETHPHTNAKPGSPTPMTFSLSTNVYCLARAFLKDGEMWAELLMKIGSNPTETYTVRVAPISPRIFYFGRVQGVLVGQKVGNLLWGQRTRSLSCVNQSSVALISRADFLLTTESIKELISYSRPSMLFNVCAQERVLAWLGFLARLKMAFSPNENFNFLPEGSK